MRVRELIALLQGLEQDAWLCCGSGQEYNFDEVRVERCAYGPVVWYELGTYHLGLPQGACEAYDAEVQRELAEKQP